MLEDQPEERACLYALGLLGEADARAFEAEAAGNEHLRRVVAELTETLANLTLSTTAMRQPAADLRRDLLARIAAEPGRVTTDRHGRLETMNPAFTAMCGYGIGELRGRKPGNILQGPDSDPAAVATLRAAVKTGRACEVELVNYHKDGSPYRVHITLEPTFDEHGAVTGFRAIERKIED